MEARKISEPPLTIRRRQLALPPPTEPTPATITAIAHVYAGPAVGLAEIQVALEPACESGKGKLVAVGVPRVEVEQIVKTILRIPGFEGKPDYHISARLIGAEKWTAQFGLALGIAIVGAYLKRPIPAEFVFIGEIDLRKRIRGGTPRLIENLRRSIESGEVESNVSICLAEGLNVERLINVRTVRCVALADAATAVWGHC
jgi:predicted ATP-dependent serine protease